MRVVFSLRKHQSCKNYYSTSRILTLPSICTFGTLTFVNRILADLMVSARNRPYSLRNSHNLPIPKHSTSFFKRVPPMMELHWTIVFLFHSNPDNYSFKRKLKNYFTSFARTVPRTLAVYKYIVSITNLRCCLTV